MKGVFLNLKFQVGILKKNYGVKWNEIRFVGGRLFGLILDTCPAKYEIYFAGLENQSRKTILCDLPALLNACPMKCNAYFIGAAKGCPPAEDSTG